jgi:hypothetical protein
MTLPEEISGNELLEVMSMIIEVGVTDLKTLLSEQKKLIRENERLKNKCIALERMEKTSRLEINVNDCGYGYKWQMGFSLDDD